MSQPASQPAFVRLMREVAFPAHHTNLPVYPTNTDEPADSHRETHTRTFTILFSLSTSFNLSQLLSPQDAARRFLGLSWAAGPYSLWAGIVVAHVHGKP